MENPIFDLKDETNIFKSMMKPERANSSVSKEGGTSNEQVLPPLSSHFVELAGRIKGSMAAMKTYAFFSRDKFKDIELGEYFYKVVSEDIEKTVSLLNCFCDYLYFNTPVKKLNTVHSLIEEGLNKHRREM